MKHRGGGGSNGAADGWAPPPLNFGLQEWRMKRWQEIKNAAIYWASVAFCLAVLAYLISLGA